jgi:hypothetical protein
MGPHDKFGVQTATLASSPFRFREAHALMYKSSTVVSHGFQLWIDTYLRDTQRRFVGRRQRYACVKMRVIRETVLDDDVTGAGKSR